jgi:hypothetical protein
MDRGRDLGIERLREENMAWHAVYHLTSAQRSWESSKRGAPLNSRGERERGGHRQGETRREGEERQRQRGRQGRLVSVFTSVAVLQSCTVWGRTLLKLIGCLVV